MCEPRLGMRIQGRIRKRGLSTTSGRFFSRSRRDQPMKLIYLALRGVERKWLRPPVMWHQARSEFAIRFGDRFRPEAA